MSERAKEVLEKLESLKEPDGSIIVETPDGSKVRYIIDQSSNKSGSK